MAQILIAILLTIVLVVFAMSNSHHVYLAYGFGEPIQIRLIFLLAVTFFSGVTFAWFWSMFSKVKTKRMARRSAAIKKTSVTAIEEVDA
jgi:uncharacterized integral membrane protein